MAKTIVKKFRSPLEFLEWASNEKSPWTGSLSSRKPGNSSWSGTGTYEEAYDLAKFGWQKGLDRLAEQVAIAAKLTPQNITPRKKRDIAGDFPDVPIAAAGDVFSMVTRGKQSKVKPIIKIQTNFGYNANVDSEKIMRWGAAIVSYVRTLELAGFSTQLDTISESKGDGGPPVSFQFSLKAAGQRLSLSNIVFWWAHPAALRRIEFSAMERLDIQEWYGYGYGQAKVITKPEPGTLFLTINDARNTMEECLQVIIDKHRNLLKNNPDSDISMVLDGYKAPRPH